jgi:hypothetical protein
MFLPPAAQTLLQRLYTTCRTKLPSTPTDPSSAFSWYLDHQTLLYDITRHLYDAKSQCKEPDPAVDLLHAYSQFLMGYVRTWKAAYKRLGAGERRLLRGRPRQPRQRREGMRATAHDGAGAGATDISNLDSNPDSEQIGEDNDEDEDALSEYTRFDPNHPTCPLPYHHYRAYLRDARHIRLYMFSILSEVSKEVLRTLTLWDEYVSRRATVDTTGLGGHIDNENMEVEVEIQRIQQRMGQLKQFLGPWRTLCENHQWALRGEMSNFERFIKEMSEGVGREGNTRE